MKSLSAENITMEGVKIVMSTAVIARKFSNISMLRFSAGRHYFDLCFPGNLNI